MRHRINCTSCGLPIRGKVHRWAQKPMHSRCYAYFTRNIIKRENLEKKIRRGMQSHRVRQSSPLTSLLKRLFS
jgi:hypothetical protein